MHERYHSTDALCIMLESRTSNAIVTCHGADLGVSGQPHLVALGGSAAVMSR